MALLSRGKSCPKQFCIGIIDINNVLKHLFLLLCLPFQLIGTNRLIMISITIILPAVIHYRKYIRTLNISIGNQIIHFPYVRTRISLITFLIFVRNLLRTLGVGQELVHLQVMMELRWYQRFLTFVID